MSETYGAFLCPPTVWSFCDSNPIIYCFEFVYISSNLASPTYTNKNNTIADPL